MSVGTLGSSVGWILICIIYFVLNSSKSGYAECSKVMNKNKINKITNLVRVNRGSWGSLSCFGST
jgi:uncharacterized membrane protein